MRWGWSAADGAQHCPAARTLTRERARFLSAVCLRAHGARAPSTPSSPELRRTVSNTLHVLRSKTWTWITTKSLSLAYYISQSWWWWWWFWWFVSTREVRSHFKAVSGRQYHGNEISPSVRVSKLSWEETGIWKNEPESIVFIYLKLKKKNLAPSRFFFLD